MWIWIEAFTHTIYLCITNYQGCAHSTVILWLILHRGFLWATSLYSYGQLHIITDHSRLDPWIWSNSCLPPSHWQGCVWLKTSSRLWSHHRFPNRYWSWNCFTQWERQSKMSPRTIRPGSPSDIVMLCKEYSEVSVHYPLSLEKAIREATEKVFKYESTRLMGVESLSSQRSILSPRMSQRSPRRV